VTFVSHSTCCVRGREGGEWSGVEWSGVSIKIAHIINFITDGKIVKNCRYNIF
jgi:hypothetical protein